VYSNGSILGPLLFLIFINDLPFLLELAGLYCKLFADDSTLIETSTQFDNLLSKFNDKIKILLNWCEFSKVDINWDKTFIMIVTNRRLKIPKSIDFNDIHVKIVDRFKLLGVTIDSKLNFEAYSSILKRNVSYKLHSIKRLFYLSASVKLQFFKTFIMPYFDYCSSLTIYFPKATIQKICNFYNYCLNKLLKIDIKVRDYKYSNNIEQIKLDSKCLLNTTLEEIGLKNYEHRLIVKLSTFIFKIRNDVNAPSLLKDMIKKNNEFNKCNTRILRNNNNFKQTIQLNNHYGEATFTYFFTNFINNIILNDLNCNFKLFTSRIMTNLNLLFQKFITNFYKFNLISNFKT
jgi:hypothetical protein